MDSSLLADFGQLMDTSLFEAKPFVYQGVQFTCAPDDGFAPVYALFEDGRESLPAVFNEGGVPLRKISVRLTDLSPSSSEARAILQG